MRAVKILILILGCGLPFGTVIKAQYEKPDTGSPGYANGNFQVFHDYGYDPSPTSFLIFHGNGHQGEGMTIFPDDSYQTGDHGGSYEPGNFQSFIDQMSDPGVGDGSRGQTGLTIFPDESYSLVDKNSY